MQIRKADKHMQTSLHGIAKKAKNSPKYRFGNLISLLNEDNLKWCFPQLNRKASPGVDGVDYDMFGTDLAGNIQKIVEDLKDYVGYFKLNSAFTVYGPELVKKINDKKLYE